MANDLRKLVLTSQQKEFILNRINVAKQFSNYTIISFLEDFIIQNFIKELGFLPILSNPVCFEGTFERVVINKTVREDKLNKQLTHYSQIKYPAVENQSRLSYNRASMKGQSVFYAGAGHLPTILETRPNLGDLYTVSKWKQKSNTLINCFSIFYNEELYERPENEQAVKSHDDFLLTLDKNVAEVTSALLSFMTDVFMKPVDSENKLEYLFSALFANHYLSNSEFTTHCLYYPSVASDYVANNIVCLPKTLDDYFDCVEVHECVCIQAPIGNANTWMARRVFDGTNINPKAIGEIEWNLHIPKEEYEDLKMLYKFE